MVAKQTIAFRCDASAQIGSGHVMRCLTLAKILAKRGDDIFFLCSAETVQTVAALRNSYYKILHDYKLDHANWLVVDHYGLDATYENLARSWAKNIFVIDDLANRPHDCDILVDMTYGRSGSDYTPLVPENCNILTGAQFALLRDAFAALSSTLKDRRDFEKPSTILISFGGVNPKNATETTLEMLSMFNNYPLTLYVVTGGGAAGLDTIRSKIDDINEGGLHNAQLYVDTPYIADLMTKSHLCIGAGGTTSWERCCLGLPTLAIELADNQSKILRELHAAGALINLGPIENLDQNEFLKAFTAILNNPDHLQKMSGAARLICDGKGAERIAELII